NQQSFAVRGKLVFHDSAQRGGALPLAPRFLFGRQPLVVADQRARVDQQPRLAAARVEGPQIQLILVVGFTLQIRDVAAVRRELRRQQPRAAQVGGAEDALYGEGRGGGMNCDK